MSADHPEDTNHGDSIAAWTSVIVITLGVAGATYFYLVANWNGVYASGIAVAVGIALGPLLKLVGLGQKK
jgi:hypothetical protein